MHGVMDVDKVGRSTEGTSRILTYTPRSLKEVLAAKASISINGQAISFNTVNPLLQEALVC